MNGSSNPQLEVKYFKYPEIRRTYHYPDGNKLSVSNVVGLAVSKSGNHRLETGCGKKWIVKDGWIGIEIEAKEWSL